MKWFKGAGWLVWMAIVVAVAGSSQVSANPSENLILSEDVLWQTAPDFILGEANGIISTDAGITIAPDQNVATYQSAELTAPLPFNALFSRWQLVDQDAGNHTHETDLPNFSLAIRTRPADGDWSDWASIGADADLTPPNATHQTGTILVVPATDQTHTHYQYLLTLSTPPDGDTPELDWLRFTFIDSSAGLSDAEISPTQETDRSNFNGYPKPAVVGRDQWCQSQPTLQCSYSNGLEYVPVTHLVVHHTVTSNASADWTAVVRAIWFFHGDASGNGWGDIGYNYLVAPNGVIYEGHHGGDNVAGTHAAYANHGSMGTAMIGNYTDDDPPWALRDSLAKLLSWKADQRDIDVFDSSKLPDAGNNATNRGLPHLMGHRDVYGGGRTSCPGAQGHPWLPWLRTEIANRIGFVSPHLYFEEYENGGDSAWFTKANANWHETIKGCGNNRHAYYTFSVTNPTQSTNWGAWRPNILQSGRYEIEIFVPYCDTDESETYGAEYEVHHANGVNYAVVNQQDSVGLWATLGAYDLSAGTDNWIRLTDLTETDTGRAVWFDAIRVRPIDVPASVTNLTPTSGGWLNNATVDFQWENINVPDGGGTTLQVATDAGMSQLIAQPWIAPGVSQHSLTFGSSFHNLFWRVAVHHPGNETLYSAVTQFSLDLSCRGHKLTVSCK